MKLSSQFDLPAAPDKVVALFFDPATMRECLPGCEELEQVDDKTYRGVLTNEIAHVKFKAGFSAVITSVEELADGSGAFVVNAVLKGEDRRLGSTIKVDARMTISPVGEESRVGYELELAMWGKLGRLGESVIRRSSVEVERQFSEALAAVCEGKPIPHRQKAAQKAAGKLAQKQPVAVAGRGAGRSSRRPVRPRSSGWPIASRTCRSSSRSLPRPSRTASSSAAGSADADGAVPSARDPRRGAAPARRARRHHGVRRRHGHPDPGQAGPPASRELRRHQPDPGLREISVDDAGVTVGPLVSLRQMETDDRVTSNAPLASATYAQVANPRVRNTASVAGNIAHGDYRLDPPTALVVLDATVELSSERGRREVSMREFFVDFQVTEVQPDELISGIRIPRQPRSAAGSFVKLSSLAENDWPCASVAALAVPADGHRRPDRAALGLGALAPMTRYLALDLDEDMSDQDVVDAAIDIANTAIDPIEDIRGSAPYKAHLGPRCRRGVRPRSDEGAPACLRPTPGSSRARGSRPTRRDRSARRGRRTTEAVRRRRPRARHDPLRRGRAGGAGHGPRRHAPQHPAARHRSSTSTPTGRADGRRAGRGHAAKDLLRGVRRPGLHRAGVRRPAATGGREGPLRRRAGRRCARHGPGDRQSRRGQHRRGVRGAAPGLRHRRRAARRHLRALRAAAVVGLRRPGAPLRRTGHQRQLRVPPGRGDAAAAHERAGPTTVRGDVLGARRPTTCRSSCRTPRPGCDERPAGDPVHDADALLRPADRSPTCSTSRSPGCACAPGRSGGGFGAKMYDRLEPLAAALAWKFQRPRAASRPRAGGGVPAHHPPRRRGDRLACRRTRTAT